jgi:hypothetical protein
MKEQSSSGTDSPAEPRRGSSLSARGVDLLRSPRVAELCWWYLLLALATSAAKLACLGSVYRHSDGFVLDEMALGTGPRLSHPVLLALILSADLVQVAGIAVGIFALASAVPPRHRSTAHRMGALALFVAMAANHISFMQLGTFASSDLLSTAWGWVGLHPASVRAYLTPSVALVALLGGAAVLLPAALARAAGRHPGLAAVHRALPWLALATTVAGLLVSPLAVARFGAGAFPVHGYWASAARAAWHGAGDTPLSVRVPPAPELLLEYRKLAFLPPQPDGPALTDPELEARIRPRHVILVGLETAPRAFYPLTTSADLPTFRRMTERAIVAERHYTTSPYTRIANFSMLSGLYAPPSGLPVRFGPIATDGLGSVLHAHGYETSYVDSWVLDWLPGSGERDQARMLGFDTVVDSAVHRDDGVYEVLVKGEEVAFDTAFSRIADADDHGHKAAVFIGTMLGHSPWPAAEGQEALGGAARLHQIALVFDRLFARLLERLAARGLAEDVLVLVVGDHGLRYADEFESLGRTYSHSDLSFNVPFLLYAPGLLDRTVPVPFPTSHVDLTPTLLHLVGVPTLGLLHHGAYMLDARLAHRVLYLSNSRLGPVDGLTWAGSYFTRHALSGATLMGEGADPASMRPLLASPAASALPLPLQDPLALLDAFAAHTNRVAGLLLQRGAAQAARQGAPIRASAGPAGP